VTRLAATVVLLALLTLGFTGACSSPGGGGGRSTSDARVRSFVGETPPSFSQGGRPLKMHALYSAGHYRGPQPTVRFVQFAFPT